MAEYKHLLVEQRGRALVLTINRPDALNTLDRETVAEMRDFFSSRWEDESFGVVIVTGAGKSFVAGADIVEMKDLDAKGGIELSARGHYLMQTIQNFPKPVIAAVNGFALGGGCELAMACDIRLASTKAKFGQPEVNLGIIPGYGGTQRLSRLVGKGKAMQLVLTGEIIKAEEAYRIGLVDELCEPEELIDKALEMAETIAGKGAIAVKLAKICVNRGLYVNLTAGCDLEKANFGITFSTADQKEGMAAFIEKRKPEFTGK